MGACDHPSLLNKAGLDLDALGATIEGDLEEGTDEGDELANMLGGLDMASGRTCEMCHTK